MPSLKEVRNRIKSVMSTQQITRAMKMVAASKLRRSQDNIVKIRPYVGKLHDILQGLSSGNDLLSSNPYIQSREIRKVLIVVVTSDRGLCGPFNSNVIKGATSLIQEKYQEVQQNGNLTLLCIGKRGLEHFRRRGYTVIDQYVALFGNLNFAGVKPAAEFCMSGFLDGQYDVVEIVYNEFRNVATQILHKDQFLPIVVQPSVDQNQKSADYIFEPSAESIVNDIIPKTLRIKFYKNLLESYASENGARMSAMDKATENAGELLKDLRLTYNRSRQASITKEILEIVGGANALKG